MSHLQDFILHILKANPFLKVFIGSNIFGKIVVVLVLLVLFPPFFYSGYNDFTNQNNKTVEHTLLFEEPAIPILTFCCDGSWMCEFTKATQVCDPFVTNCVDSPYYFSNRFGCALFDFKHQSFAKDILLEFNTAKSLGDLPPKINIQVGDDENLQITTSPFHMISLSGFMKNTTNADKVKHIEYMMSLTSSNIKDSDFIKNRNITNGFLFIESIRMNGPIEVIHTRAVEPNFLGIIVFSALYLLVCYFLLSILFQKTKTGYQIHSFLTYLVTCGCFKRAKNMQPQGEGVDV